MYLPLTVPVSFYITCKRHQIREAFTREGNPLRPVAESGIGCARSRGGRLPTGNGRQRRTEPVGEERTAPPPWQPENGAPHPNRRLTGKAPAARRMRTAAPLRGCSETPVPEAGSQLPCGVQQRCLEKLAAPAVSTHPSLLTRVMAEAGFKYTYLQFRTHLCSVKS